MSSNSYQTSGNSGLSALKIPYSASSHPEKKSRTHGPGWNEQSSIPGEFRGVYRKMVMVNMVSVSLGLPDLDGMVRLQGISFAGSHRCSRCQVTPTYMRSSSPIRSGEGGPYRMVRTRCESAIRIKFLNPDSRIRIQMHSHSVWYDSRIRTTSGSGIICILHFWWIFFYGSGPEDPDPGSRHTQQL